MADARKRKRKQPETTPKSGRRSGRVKTYVSQVAKGNPLGAVKKKAWTVPMLSPRKMSPLVRWEQLRPAGCVPRFWLQLFVNNESLWPDIAEEVRYALIEGEIERWEHEPEDVTVSISCLGLRCGVNYTHELTRDFRTPVCPVCQKPHPFAVNLTYPRGIAADAE